ncbi:cache domain-containing sensor histidine kinase [Paenibacillus sacheonensis]|uniref:histidine kinase n=1 Tax=Paenibacillus sacheonensis TaxID=742054 RepID=A0A7X4YTA6_9BACL|nr:sensor histidine kinase [Paenibacillus sacheonensis]MBM7568472.1 two-component system sensor histidine kinase YesM [Paenibacillus sacheonensis]NBC72170.1 HAMP domain-containing protein [Paenibacillus sacheonensis]
MRRVLDRIRTGYRDLLLKRKIALAFSLMAVFLLVVQGTVIYNISERVIRNEMESAAKQTIAQSSLNIDSYFQEIKTIIQLTANNRTLIDSVEHYDSSYYDQIRYNENLQNILIQYTYMIPYVDNILVIRQGRAIYDKNSSSRKDYDFDDKAWFAEGVSPLVKASFVGPHRNDYYYDGMTTNVVSVIIPVRDPQKQGEPEGEIMIDIDLRKITNLFGRIGLGDDQDISIVDKGGRIIANRDERSIGGQYAAEQLSRLGASENGTYTVKGGGVSSLVVYSTSAVTGWKTVISTKMTKIAQVAGDVRFTALLTIAAAILLAAAISVFVSSQITKGLIRLKKRMDALSRGNESALAPAEGNDEVGMLGRHFDRMAQQLNQLINENYIAKIKQQEAELSALQAKINPHFLNNTLQSLHAMAVLDRTRELETTIESLGRLFDYVLYDSGDIVRVDDELQYLASYLQIQQSRNAKRFDYAIEAEASVRRTPVPKLLVQPLVENALIHGLDALRTGGYIRVEVELEAGAGIEPETAAETGTAAETRTPAGARTGAAADEERILIRVSDNGEGMSEERLAWVTAMLEGEMPAAKSIGLRNVRDRLQLLHGDRAFLRIESRPGEGTVLTIGFPIPAGSGNANT